MPSSTPRLMRELRAKAKDLAPPGAMVTVGMTNGGHIVCEMHWKGRQRKVFTSASPSDRRAHRALETELRAAIRYLQEEQ